jgi:hypothetical protein
MTILRSAALILAALAGTTGFGQQALGQTGSGQSGMSTSGELGNVKVLGDLEAFGRCYASTDRKGALALIATKPGSTEEQRVYRKLARLDQDCLFGGTRMLSSVVYIRGAIAEGLLKSGGVPADLLLPAPAAAEVTSLSEAARCYTSGHRAEVRALLEMKAGTREEVAAVGALWSGFRTCLPKRANVRLNALWIRFLLAEAMLRLSPPAAATSGN